MSNDNLSDIDALKNFLSDIECLEPLAEWTSKFNIFDILKITKTEIRHSNMLSWLLNANESHGLGDSILRGVMQYAVETFSDSDYVFDILLADYHEFEILREWRNIDILAVAESQKIVLCIENKIDAVEHNNQLNNYKRIVDDSFQNYKKMFIFLSPDGKTSSDPENWCSMGYQDVLTIIENARRKTKILPEADLLIDNYVEAVRRNIVGDEKLARICTDIYKKHKRALDLIFENMPDVTSNISATLLAWARHKAELGELKLISEKCSKTYIRFKTDAMSNLMPDAETALSGWNTHNYYFYEINLNANGFKMQLSLSSKDIPQDLLAVCNKINEYSPSKSQKDNWQWRIPFSTKYTKFNENYSEEYIFKLADKHFKDLMIMESKLLNAINADKNI